MSSVKTIRRILLILEATTYSSLIMKITYDVI